MQSFMVSRTGSRDFRLCFALAGLAMIAVAACGTRLHAQPPPINKPSVSAGASASGSTDNADVDAQREKLWNSPEMLSARAYLETYFSRSAKITDKQAEEYMDNLKAMDPADMQVWLLKYEAKLKSIRRSSEVSQMGRQMSIAGRQPAPNVGGFQNPYAGRQTASSGVPVGGLQPQIGAQANALAPRPVQKPFSSPQYQRARAAQEVPLINGEDMARYEIWRGIVPWGY